MALEIGRYGIVQRHKDGATTILRPGRNGGAGTEIAVSDELADQFRLVTGDIVAGETEEFEPDFAENRQDKDDFALDLEYDTQIDEPNAGRARVTFGGAKSLFPTERLRTVTRINGLDLEEAEERPFPKTQRGRSERTPPDFWLQCATGADDWTGRAIDFAAPLGAGSLGIVRGPHGSGLTQTLQAVLNGIVTNAPAAVPIVLLLRARAEEATEWRGRFSQADVIVVSSEFGEGGPQRLLRICDLALEAAQRQSELGRDVVLLIDSLTGLWGAMLEAESADAQQEADQSQARQRIREWAQKAGCFHGAGLLGGGLGGSLTIIGTVWHQAIDAEAEEERDIHPHLRLWEHLGSEAIWLVALSETLSRRRLYPAIDIKQCRSQYEGKFLPVDMVESLLTVRGSLPRHDSLACYQWLMAAMEAAPDIGMREFRVEG